MPYEDFEDSTLTSPLTLTNPASLITIPSATQFKNGAHSMALNLNGLAAPHYVELPLNVDNACVSFWFRTGSYAAWNGGALIFEAGNVFSTGAFRFWDWRSNSLSHREMADVDVPANQWDVTDYTWYAFMFKYARNGTCRYRLYDAASTLIGSEFTRTETNNDPLIAFRIGCDANQGGGVNENTIIYFDSLTWDTTTLTWPLLPNSEGGGGPTVALGNFLGGFRRVS